MWMNGWVGGGQWKASGNSTQNTRHIKTSGFTWLSALIKASKITQSSLFFALLKNVH